jgi:hypothetical protein
MQTLIDATKVNDSWRLLYAMNYPVKENDEFKWYPLEMIDAHKGTIGYNNGIEVIQLSLTSDMVRLSPKEEEKFVNECKWNKIVFDNGESMIFPPRIEEAYE